MADPGLARKSRDAEFEVVEFLLGLGVADQGAFRGVPRVAAKKALAGGMPAHELGPGGVESLDRIMKRGVHHNSERGKTLRKAWRLFRFGRVNVNKSSIVDRNIGSLQYPPQLSAAGDCLSNIGYAS